MPFFTAKLKQNTLTVALSAALAGSLMLTPVSSAVAATNVNLEDRVQRLERMMENPVLLQLSRRLGDQQREIQQLQDANDRLKRQVQMLQKKLDQRYSETDQRLSVLEGNGPAADVSVGNTNQSLPTAEMPTAPEGSENIVNPAAAPTADASNAVSEPVATDKVAENIVANTAVGADDNTQKPAEQTVSNQASNADESSTNQPAPQPTQPTAITTHKPTDAEQAAYKEAFGLMRSSKYDESIQAFEAFLSQYPQSELASNAAYWSGEGYLVKGNNEAALKAFMVVIERYPTSPKVPDAKLRAGDSYDNLNQPEKAKGMYLDVIESRPSSRAADTAKKRLEK